MTLNEVLENLKQINGGCVQEWTLPLRLNREDALAAELIEIAMNRLGDDAKHWQLLAVSSAFFWWTQALLSLGEQAPSCANER